MKKTSSEKTYPVATHLNFKVGGVNPHRDWTILISTFLVVTALVVGANLYVFFGIQNGTFFTMPERQEGNDTALNMEKLNVVVGIFEAKKSKLAELRSATSAGSVVDPSN